MPILTLHIDDRSHAALERCAASLGRDITDLAESAVSDAAIMNDPDRSLTGQPPLRFSTPEDGQHPSTPEDGMPVMTR